MKVIKKVFSIVIHAETYAFVMMNSYILLHLIVGKRGFNNYSALIYKYVFHSFELLFCINTLKHFNLNQKERDIEAKKKLNIPVAETIINQSCIQSKVETSVPKNNNFEMTTTNATKSTMKNTKSSTGFTTSKQSTVNAMENTKSSIGSSSVNQSTVNATEASTKNTESSIGSSSVNQSTVS